MLIVCFLGDLIRVFVCLCFQALPQSTIKGGHGDVLINVHVKWGATVLGKPSISH